MDNDDTEDALMIDQIARNLHGIEAPMEQVTIEIKAEEMDYIKEMASDLCIELGFATN